jgi:hypothetical protein
VGYIHPLTGTAGVDKKNIKWLRPQEISDSPSLFINGGNSTFWLSASLTEDLCSWRRRRCSGKTLARILSIPKSTNERREN